MAVASRSGFRRSGSTQRRRPMVRIALVLAIVASATPLSASAQAPVTCGSSPVTLTGTVVASQAKTYLLEPFDVPPSTARVEVGYTWDPVEAGVIDLGVWDSSGTEGPDAFRSWSGSRQGRIDQSMPPQVIAPDVVERTVVTGTIEPGTWHIELGIAALEQPLDWRVEIRCPVAPDGVAATPLPQDPVDPTHVARPQAGWYAGDFHLHGFHSSPDGPTPDEMVEAARAAGLDIIPVTEYVTPAHWTQLGATQRANPDLLIWPGREVITYFGHMIVLGETPSGIEYRVGHDGTTLAQIQQSAAGDGALVSLAHPTIFPPDTFGSACRGCYFELLDEVDFDSTHLIEIVTEGSMASFAGRDVPNPFVRPAIELWERLLNEGHRLVAVSGSDDKQGADYGKTSTMVFADELSRPAIDEALRRGHAYVRGLGRDSPELDMRARGPDGRTAMIGDTLVADTADFDITVRDGVGTTLAIKRNGEVVSRVEVNSDPFVHSTTIDRAADEGPLGTFWGAELIDHVVSPGIEVPTVVANPVFLASEPAPEPQLPTFEAVRAEPAKPAERADSDRDRSGSPTNGLLVVAGLLTIAGAAAGLAVRKRRTQAEDASAPKSD